MVIIGDVAGPAIELLGDFPGIICKDMLVHHSVSATALGSNQEKLFFQSSFSGVEFQSHISSNKPGPGNLPLMGHLETYFPPYTVFQGELLLGLVTKALRLQPSRGEEPHRPGNQDLPTYLPRDIN